MPLRQPKQPKPVTQESTRVARPTGRATRATPRFLTPKDPTQLDRDRARARAERERLEQDEADREWEQMRRDSMRRPRSQT